MKKCSENKNTVSKIIKEGLTIGIIVPYVCWAILHLMIDNFFIGITCLFDIAVVAFTGYCLFQRYLRRDKDETAKSRLQCLLAAWAVMFWIAVGYSLPITALTMYVSSLGVPQWSILALFGILKGLQLIKIADLIDPHGEKLVVSRYSEIYEDSGKDDGKEVIA